MGKFLDKFIGSLPAIQGKQIFNLLTDMKTDGQIKSVKEFNAMLQELMLKMQDQRGYKPLFEFFKARIGNKINSDQYNTMIKACAYDLQAAFGELNTIDKTLNAHKDLFKLDVLTKLEKSIDDLDSRITLYEFLAGQSQQYAGAQYETFINSGGNILSRSQPMAASLYRDPNRNLDMDATTECACDSFGQYLTLPLDTLVEIRPAKVEIYFDGTTTQSKEQATPETMNIRNLIDQNKQTTWLYSILTDTSVTGGAILKLRFDLGGFVTFNKIEIEHSVKGLIINSLSYIDETGTLVDANAMTDDEVDYGEAYYFEPIRARYVILEFTHPTNIKVDYQRQSNGDSWNILSGEVNTNLGLDECAPEITQVLTDEKLQSIIGIDSIIHYDTISLHSYNFNFENIRFYNAEYQSNGIYVSQPIRVNKPGLISLATTEEMPLGQLDPDIVNQVNKFGFEYYIAKADYEAADNALGALIRYEIVPIIPTGYDGVTTERLYMEKRSDSLAKDTALFRFIPDLAMGEPAIIRNLIEGLAINTDYSVRVQQGTWRTDWATAQQDIDSLSGQTYPFEVEIKFNEVDPHDILTASYYVSTTNITSVETDQTIRRVTPHIGYESASILRCVDDNKLVDKTNIGDSEIYLIAIMRNNWLTNKHTCRLLDYTLLVSQYQIEE